MAHEDSSLPTPVARVVGIAIALSAVLSIILLAFLWPTITSSVTSLPIAIAGPSAQVDLLSAALDEKSPDTFEIATVDDRQAAVDLIETRQAYGAIVLGAEPEVLTASAASAPVAQILAGLAPTLAAQLNAAAAAQGIQLPAPITVATTDVVPLASTDERGVGFAASSFPLLLGGLLGGVAISLAIVGARRRMTATLVYAVVGGLAVTGILQGWFGWLQGNFWFNAAAVGLTLLAMAGTIVGLASLLGRPGVAIGALLFLLIANPISAAAQPVEFLLAPWGAIGQWFPPGAAVTLLRDLSYFPLADALLPWLVLAGWAVVGLVLLAAGHYRNTGAATGHALAEAN